MFQVKDFIETSEGLVFAIVMAGLEQNKVRCFLRYIRQDNTWQKVNTEQANTLLKKNYPQYLFHSVELDADLHAVPVNQINKHHQAQERLQYLMQTQSDNNVEQDLRALIHLLEQNGINSLDWGITGSLLLGSHNAHSDIDLVCYDLTILNNTRRVIAQLIQEKQLNDLTQNAWQESYLRRDCDLTFEEYCWHEQRKFNKGLIHQRKFDLSCVTENKDNTIYQKKGHVVIQAKVINDSRAFAYPAEFIIEHETIKSIVCFTATYIGQAFNNEWISAAGLIEQNELGEQRLVIGSSREARGEYIKVIV
jgi:predicted nucleotidyltransferase